MDIVLYSVEGTDKLPVVVIMASSAFHYTGLQKKEDQDSVEWALKSQLGRECSLRLLPPGSAGGTILPPAIPPPTPPASIGNSPSKCGTSIGAQSFSASRTFHSTGCSAAQNSTATAGASHLEKEPAQEKQSTALPSDPSVPIPLHRQPPALARNPIVRENSSSNTDAGVQNSSLPEMKENVTTHLKITTKKAKRHPVVKEVMRMFKAEIKDIHLK